VTSISKLGCTAVPYRWSSTVIQLGAEQFVAYSVERRLDLIESLYCESHLTGMLNEVAKEHCSARIRASV
jgi:hypothetical protein